MAPVTGRIEYVWLVPLQTLAFPVMAPGTAGMPVGVTASVYTTPDPQAFPAATVTLPLVVVVLAGREVVLEEPDQPVGIVHV